MLENKTLSKDVRCLLFNPLKPWPSEALQYSDTNFWYVLFVSSTGLLTWYGGLISEDKIFVNLGGDHGQGSMKLTFQLASVAHPNSTKNTVVFTLYEGKDTRNNGGL